MSSATRVLIFSDNVFVARALFRLLAELTPHAASAARYRCSLESPLLAERDLPFVPAPCDLRTAAESIAAEFDLVFSAHCKQLFPPALVRAVRCVNIHPGLNPHNRGWYPQVFSILNGRPLGATLHLMDEQLDHGPIIAQEEVPLHSWDTSLTAYERVLEAEIRLLRQHLPAIVSGEFTARPPAEEGNVNGKKDFAKLCRLNLDDTDTLAAHLDLLRALTHGHFDNAYFVDPVTGHRVYVKVSLTPDRGS